ncbi:dehydrogenase [Alicyclobacillus cellulosilyticus]|uniref:Dehydrogenase n=1 Tax=Alicyclobacillus cellulosilyticus TaxID=1003997 RepID=A0A917K6Q6_9BACL|nr:Gfo/Idh/MocA family oxidoreductase [Alicyclobacillus cellulosilyticus]GGJ02043.1 dehydrogenase [Alicyclobacillus cellulosilyticus]
MTPRETIKVGVVGCGNISAVYLRNLRSYDVVDVVACADIDEARARARAAEFGIPKACTVEELLRDDEIQLVVNLTVPQAHAEVCLAALAAGKHVYVEKPLAVSLEDGRHILALAAEKGLRVGTAPDTVLGGGIQTCRKLIDDGLIGRPVAAVAFMMSHGHESWHPNPEFYYQVGGGPMFDMGPYYLTALVTLIGPMRRVTGSAQITFPERTITSQPKFGQTIRVETPTHIAGVIDFAGGAVGTIITSFDVWFAQLPFIEIYGTEGTISVPDPNTFGGPVRLRRRGEDRWQEVPLTHGFTENCRGVGVAEMACAILTGREHRCHGAVGYHVLEAMHGFHLSSAEGRHYTLQSRCDRPAALPEPGPGDDLRARLRG